MAITQWDIANLPTRPGLYSNFVEAAAAQINGGVRGVVGIPLKSHTGGTAEDNKFYEVNGEERAKELFGAGNINSIKLALQGGAREVLVYTLPSPPAVADYSVVRDAFEARQFSVFSFDGEITSEEQTATVTWVARNRTERKHFFFVAGGSATDDQDITVGNARTTSLKDEYTINLVTGVETNGTTYSSGQYAAYIAGLVASTPINRSITYTEVPVDDVTKRLRNSEIISALEAGSLVLVNDGDSVKIEQGLTTSGNKIRAISARQQVAYAIERTARNNYIGKLDNNEDGQMALINAIKAYLEALEASNVIILPDDGGVILDPQRPSVGDTVFLIISYIEVDSMERIFLTINV